MKPKISGDQKKLLVKMFNASGAPPELRAKLMPLIGLMETLGASPKWGNFQRAAKFIAREWGLDLANKMCDWLEALKMCLEVERRIEMDKFIAKMQKKAEADLKRRTKRGEDTTGMGEYLDAAPGSSRIRPMLVKMLGKRKKGAKK